MALFTDGAIHKIIATCIEQQFVWFLQTTGPLALK